MDLRIHVVVHDTIFGARVLGTIAHCQYGATEAEEMSYIVGALFALNSQWKTRIVFLEASPLTYGLGLFRERRKSSTPAIVLTLRAPGI